MARIGVSSLWIGCLILAGCGGRQSSSIQPILAEKAFGSSIPVETLMLKSQDYEDDFSPTGLIEAEEEVTVSAEIAGRIIKIHHDIGSEIQVGDLLVALDEASVRAQINKIKAQIARAKTMLLAAGKDLERERALFQTNIATQRTLDDAILAVQVYENDVAATEADLELVEVDLQKFRIHSPIAGTVSRKYVAIGEYVTPGVKLFDIVMVDKVDFVFTLAERDISKVHTGDRLEVKIDALEERTFTGEIKAIAPVGNPGTRTFRVELMLDNPDPHRILPGMAGRVRVVRARYKDVYLVPEESIQRGEGSRSYVYLAREGRAVEIEITILSAVEAKAVISADFGEAPELIILGQYAVEQDSSITIRQTHEEIPELIFD